MILLPISFLFSLVRSFSWLENFGRVSWSQSPSGVSVHFLFCSLLLNTQHSLGFQIVEGGRADYQLPILNSSRLQRRQRTFVEAQSCIKINQSLWLQIWHLLQINYSAWIASDLFLTFRAKFQLSRSRESVAVHLCDIAPERRLNSKITIELKATGGSKIAQRLYWSRMLKLLVLFALNLLTAAWPWALSLPQSQGLFTTFDENKSADWNERIINPP